MSKNIVIIGMVGLLLLFSIIVMTGCAKKSVVQEQATPKADVTKGETATKEFTGKEASKRDITEGEASIEKENAAKEEFKDIYFDFDKFNLKPEARGTLEQHAAILTKNKNYNVLIEGHCDERGTTEYNLALGERRAKEAMKYFVELGIDGKRLKTISYGKERPLNPEHNEEAWAQNRRDHFVVKLLK